MFPKIQSLCPFKLPQLPSAEQNFCRSCARQVHNLDAMSAQQRQTFLSACSGKVCVAYSVHKPMRNDKAKMIAMLGGAALLSNSAIAQDQEDTGSEFAPIEQVIVMGGTINIDSVEFVPAQALEIPELNANAPELEFTATPK